ncbi:hypothetical protein Tco_0924398 [Tanacetum coccineum]|uniref:Uncharacterized protein n=1 Tax=Tanacetum coccineum TaxID=301880 RepID=A0ABQ5D4T7_9ASTR
MATNEETNAAGTDTRPPMLVENDYESWKIRIHSSMDEENKLEMANNQAKIISVKVFPTHLTILNRQALQRSIWDTCGNAYARISSRPLQQRNGGGGGGEKISFDEYELFVQLEMSPFRLLSYGVKYVTNVKHNMISQPHLFQSYTHLNPPTISCQKDTQKQDASQQVLFDHWPMLLTPTSAPTLIITLNSSPQPTCAFPPTNKSAQTFSNSRTQCYVHDGHMLLNQSEGKLQVMSVIQVLEAEGDMLQQHRRMDNVARQCKEPKRKMDSHVLQAKALLMKLKRKEKCLDA